MNVISIERSEFVPADLCKEFGCIMRYIKKTNQNTQKKHQQKTKKRHWARDKGLIVLIVLRGAEAQKLFPLFRKQKWADISICLSLFLRKMRLLFCRN